MCKKYSFKLSGFILSALWMFTACQTGEEKTDTDMQTEKTIQIAVLVGEGFHDGEVYMPLGFFTNQGAELTVIGPEAGRVMAYNSGFTIEIEKAVSEVSVDDFDALILPGGHAPDSLRKIDEVVVFARNFFLSGKLTAAICHGPQILITANVMEGKTATGFPGIREEFEEAGVNYLDEKVVIDGNLITSRIPTDLFDFVTAIQAALDASR